MEIHLPEVPLEGIFSYLDGFSLLQAAQVNKSWNVVADRESLWRRLCLRKWYFGDITREHLCKQLWQQLGTQTWKQFFLRRTRQERCMQWARPEDFIYREIAGDYGDFRHVKYLSGSGLTMDGQGKSILCTVSDKGTLSTWDVQEGVKIWSSPVQESIIINLATLPEMQLAITLDMQRTLKVWNCRDRNSLTTLTIPQGCYTLKAFVAKNVPFLMVGDCEGHIYTFMLPELWYLSTVKAFAYDVELLYCSPENKWVLACNMRLCVFPKFCYGAYWTPRTENRIIVMCQKASHKITEFITFDLGLVNIGGKEVVTAQQIANFLIPAHIKNPKFMGVSDTNVIAFGNGPSLFLYTIDGHQLHRFEDHQRDIRNLWVI
ncbi:F-box/WD repeat-containing protein 12-like [Nannospalax galili]|uniref:F-box/WD repeat-containing protein 12-like n=1 Tax=Nannospalax galili TaxID=1026970 RepID=UPI000819F070|nr:F-box/WD repeat-containing protein 12-like [Nannospalax galili]